MAYRSTIGGTKRTSTNMFANDLLNAIPEEQDSQYTTSNTFVSRAPDEEGPLGEIQHSAEEVKAQ